MGDTPTLRICAKRPRNIFASTAVLRCSSGNRSVARPLDDVGWAPSLTRFHGSVGFGINRELAKRGVAADDENHTLCQ